MFQPPFTTSLTEVFSHWDLSLTLQTGLNVVRGKNEGREVALKCVLYCSCELGIQELNSVLQRIALGSIRALSWSFIISILTIYKNRQTCCILKLYISRLLHISFILTHDRELQGCCGRPAIKSPPENGYLFCTDCSLSQLCRRSHFHAAI